MPPSPSSRLSLNSSQYLLLLVVVAVLINVAKCNEHCGIIHPVTTVARTNELIIATCQALDTTFPPDMNDPETHAFVIFDNAHNSKEVNATEYAIRGITWSCYLHNCTVYVNMSSPGNVSIHCSDEYFACETDIAHVYIVDVEKVPRPSAPVVQLVESGTLNVSWSPPWEYPVNNYSLRVTLANGTLMNITTTTDTSSIITRPDGLDCQVLQFSVLASTDIGQSDYSNITIGSFLQDLNESFFDDAIEGIQKFTCNDSLTYKINGKQPNSCPHENYSYAYVLTAIDDQERVIELLSITPNMSVPATFFQLTNAGLSKEINVTLTITNLLTSTIINELIDLDDLNLDAPIKQSINHPNITVALIGTVAVFYCSMYGNDNGSDNDMSVIINGSTNYSDPNINVTKQLNGEYKISILAQASINRTEIQCFISPCFSKTATLIVVKERPLPVIVQTDTIIENTAVNISWSPLWPHPVNYYAVVIEYLNDPQQNETYLITDTYYYVLKAENGFECRILEISVDAVTDIGEIKVIDKKNLRFFKGLKNIDRKSSLNSTYEFHETSTPTLQVSFPPPEVCKDEMLVYQFTLQNYETDFSRSLTSRTNSSVAFELDSISLLQHSTLTFNITVNISDGIEYRFVPLFTNFTIYTSGDTRREPISIPVIIIIVSVLGGSLLLLLCCLVVLVFVCMKRIEKNKRARLNKRSNIIDTNNFVPPPMVINPQYATAEDVLYERIDDIMKPMPMYSIVAEINDPPSLPPRSEKSTKDDPNTSKSEDDYVKMNGVGGGSPRYVKAPTIKTDEFENGEIITSFNFESSSDHSAEDENPETLKTTTE